MEHFWGIFEDWKGQDVAGKQSRWYEMTYGEKGVKFTDKKYRQKLIDDGFTRYGMSIRAVGVWDTVGMCFMISLTAVALGCQRDDRD